MSEKMRDYASTVAAFKKWYDDQWLGDQEHGQFIPLPSDKQYQEYIDGYTLALGAWIAALRTHENGGQESEAGAFAWLHEIVEPDGYKTGMFSFKPDNPWSHWMKSHRGECKYAKSPLYLAPPSAPAIEAAAIMKCVEICRAEFNHTAANKILALIPQDGRTALFDKCMEVAEAVNKATICKYETGASSDLRAIVTNLIGVLPLNSETVSGEE